MSETRLNSNQINVGNESAIDLLITQNKAKSELASNLQGLGISANASTDTLEQLVYKVSTVSADNNRQKPKSLAINTSSRNSDYYSLNHYIVKNDWIFSRNGTAFRYKKLDALKAKVTNYDRDEGTNLSMTSKTVSSRGDIGEGYEQTIFFNNDGSNMYVVNTSTISKYSVEGYNTDTLTIGTAETLTPQINNTAINIKWIDINNAETKILVTDTDGNVGIYDLTGSASQNISPAFTGETEAIWFFTNNSSDDVFRVYMPDDASYYISFYTFSNNTIGNQIGSTTEIIRSTSYNWRRGILKYKDSNNKYKVFLSSGGINTDNIPSFIMIDCDTKSVSNIFCKLNNANAEVLENLLPVTLTEVGNYKYLLSGMILAVFDSNWNLVGNCINRIKDPEYGQNALQNILLYDGDIFDFGDYNDNRVIYSAIKHKTWLDKIVAYEREATINGTTKRFMYFSEVTAADLNNGWYDI